MNTRSLGSVYLSMADISSPLKHTFILTVEVDSGWVDYLTKYPDIFKRSSAGYWLHGAALDAEQGWLVYEEVEGSILTESDLQQVLKTWSAGDPLPPRWFRLDRAAALRAREEGVKRWGVDWYEQVDGQREDVVVQLALLGEVRYG